MVIRQGQELGSTPGFENMAASEFELTSGSIDVCSGQITGERCMRCGYTGEALHVRARDPGWFGRGNKPRTLVGRMLRGDGGRGFCRTADS
jgi:hypothetical protein